MEHKDEAPDQQLIITDEELVERIEHLAWEHEVPKQQLLHDFCLHGLFNYEEVLTVR